MAGECRKMLDNQADYGMIKLVMIIIFKK